MKLKDLSKELEYKERAGPGGRVLAYIDARQVMDLLDEVVGAENWQCDYKDVNGKVYCGIAIDVSAKDSPANWVWKWDMGTESDFEPEKGEASDAFKRAAVKWGIGRFLYDLKPTGGNVTASKTISKTTPDADWASLVGDEAPVMGKDLGVCVKCGAPNRLSAAGKVYCSAVCWKNK